MNSLIEDHYIRDASIIKISIYEENFYLTIEVDLKLINPPKNILRFKFHKVQEYSFCWNSNHSFYYIEDYKFKQTSSHFYLSFDPDPCQEEISETDNDYILSESLEYYLLNED